MIRVIAGAAGNDPGLFLKGLETLLSPEGKATLAAKRDEVTDIVTSVLGKGTGNDAGLRMTAVFKLLQTKFSINVPPVIKQNLLSALRALGAGSSRTVTENLTNDGVINADNNPAAAPKERRFMTIWP